MNKIASLLLISCLLTACATPVKWQAVGGSRADGVVKLHYDKGEFEKIIHDDEYAHNFAKKRCKAWGYDDVESFEGISRQCIQDGGLVTRCALMRFTREYQCISKRDVAMLPYQQKANELQPINLIINNK